MSKLPGIKETVEWVNTLESTVRDFAAREQELSRKNSAELGKLHRTFQKNLEEQHARISRETRQAEAIFESEKQLALARRQARDARIQSATQSSRLRRKAQGDDQENRAKFQAQRDHLQTNRNREAELKTADTQFDNFTRELELDRERLERLEFRAWQSFRGYKNFRKFLGAPPEAAEASPPDFSRDENQLLLDFRRLLDKTKSRLNWFTFSPLPLLFRILPVWALAPLMLLGFFFQGPILEYFGRSPLSLEQTATFAGAALAGILLLYFLGMLLAKPSAIRIARTLHHARALHDVCAQKAADRHQQEKLRINGQAEIRIAELQQQWNEAEASGAESRNSWNQKVQVQAARLSSRIEQQFQKKVGAVEQRRAAIIAHFEQEKAATQQQLEQARADEEQKLRAISHPQWEELAGEWRERVDPLYESFATARARAAELFPDWDSSFPETWTPPEQFVHAAKIGSLEVDLSKLPAPLPQEPRLALPGPARFSLPLALTFPDQGSIFFQTQKSGRKEVFDAFNQIMLRLLAVTPPGKLSFTIIDPVELGQNFAGIMHLADYEGSLINDRIWTQTAQIEQRLADLNDHIEKVTQMYLRNEYESITEYNQQAGRIAEKYHFLIVADFPSGFSDVAARRLRSIAASGARCGVYTFIHWDRQRPLPHDLPTDQLQSNSLSLRRQGDSFVIEGKQPESASLLLDAPPPPEIATPFLHQAGRASIDSNRVEMPFAEVAPSESELWSLDATAELRVPIGRTGATKLQYLALGKGTRQHALIAGKTGSGKSTLFHVAITNLALWCSPEQVEFYLVDFKKGVEFKAYAANRLPHARVIAIESDREFGLSVLQRVDEELKRRGDLFRNLGASDLSGYKKAGGTDSIPRTLLIIDEFQEFFVEDDRVSQTAALLLDRIVRQGRAFGIHALLGSQTLGGAYTLARATLGQMVVRIALQCNEADAYLIMDDENSAPRLLSRPGEAIYNDTAGSVEGNSPFQVVWLPDEERETYLQKVLDLTQRTPDRYPSPVVFEGNAPADARENVPLRRLLEAASIQPPSAPRVWLGAPNSIKGPTEALFKRQSGNHLLLVGQRDEAILGIFGLALIALAAQHPPGSARFILFDSSPPESSEREFLERVVQGIPQGVHLANLSETESLMTGLKEELEARAATGQTAGAPAIYLLIHGVHLFKKLRYEEDFEFSLDANQPAPPGNQLNKIICEGAGLGIHVIVSCDTANNLARTLSRKAVSEFEMRVLFQMSANDSATLIDTPKAGQLGLHRAIFYNGHEGHMEIFRPCALPNRSWLDQTFQHLARLLA